MIDSSPANYYPISCKEIASVTGTSRLAEAFKLWLSQKPERETELLFGLFSASPHSPVECTSLHGTPATRFANLMLADCKASSLSPESCGFIVEGCGRKMQLGALYYEVVGCLSCIQ